MYPLFFGNQFTLINKTGMIPIGLCLTSSSLSELEAIVTTYLHSEELAYYETLIYDRKKLSYLIGRFSAKQAIIQIVKDLDLSDIRIDYGQFRYPLVHYKNNDGLHVSYSHSSNVAIALAYPESAPLAVDIELIEEDKEPVIISQLTAEEINLVKQLSYSESIKSLTLFWTAKEALSKVLRTGLMTPFEIFAIKQIIAKSNQAWEFEFKNFPQYKTLSFQLVQFMCSIIYPRSLQLSLDINRMQDWLMQRQ